MKRCITCDELKELIEFHKQSYSSDGHRNDCKLCRKTKKKKDKNPLNKRCTNCDEIFPNTLQYFYKESKTGRTRGTCKICMDSNSKENHFLTRYNLTKSQLVIKKNEQNNNCKICGVPSYRLVVDHNHSTGKVRDLLCDTCNTGIGMFKENTEVMKKAIEYLNYHNRLALNEIRLIRN